MKNRLLRNVSFPKFGGLFCASILVYHITFNSFFPVDENNVLLAPDWYVFVGMAVAVVIGLLFGKKKPLSEKRYNRLSARRKEGLYLEAVSSANSLLDEHGSVSASLLQRRIPIGFSVAVTLLNRMEEEGLFIQSEAGKWLPAGRRAQMPSDQSESCSTIFEVDNMEGHAFEHWCAELLQKLGYHDVEVTPGSGDQGVDILAQKDGIRYAVQCKCYASNLGNTPIQEVHAGKSMYHCQIGVVMTNRHFTQGGKELAENTGVLLWDRDWIRTQLESISNIQRKSVDEFIAEAKSRKTVARPSPESDPEQAREKDLSRTLSHKRDDGRF